MIIEKNVMCSVVGIMHDVFNTSLKSAKIKQQVQSFASTNFAVPNSTILSMNKNRIHIIEDLIIFIVVFIIINV